MRSILPTDCEAQTSGLEAFQSVAALSPADLVAYFSANPRAAHELLQQSHDKRYTPSTFIDETTDSYQVGWFDHERKHLQHYAEFSQAAADYLLFSFGKGRSRCQTI
jgi:hypothetical protein